jgi:hypothetical protein
MFFRPSLHFLGISMVTFAKQPQVRKLKSFSIPLLIPRMDRVIVLFFVETWFRTRHVVIITSPHHTLNRPNVTNMALTKSYHV